MQIFSLKFYLLYIITKLSHIIYNYKNEYNHSFEAVKRILNKKQNT